MTYTRVAKKLFINNVKHSQLHLQSGKFLHFSGRELLLSLGGFSRAPSGVEFQLYCIIALEWAGPWWIVWGNQCHKASLIIVL